MFNRLAYQKERMSVYENEAGWARITSSALPGAAIAAMRPDYSLLLVQEQRFLALNAPTATIWNIPRGASDPGETPEQTAQREFSEETGIELATSRFDRVTGIRPDTGMLLGHVDLFLVDLTWEESEKIRPQPGEIERIQWMSRAMLQRMLKSGELEDSFTLAALGVIALR